MSERKLIKIRNIHFGDILFIFQLADTQVSPNFKKLNSHPKYSIS